MTEEVKLLAAELDWSAVPGAHMVEGEHRLPQVVLWPLHVCHDIPECTHMTVYDYTHNKNVILGKKKKVPSCSSHFQMCKIDVPFLVFPC